MHFDTGNTGFMLIAASLVMLMTPGSHSSTAAWWAGRTSSRS